MNVDELREVLDKAAGPAPPADGAYAALMDSVRRSRRRRQAAVALVICLAVTAVTAVIVMHRDRPSDERVATAPPTSTDATTTSSSVPEMPPAIRSALDAWKGFPVDQDPRPLIMSDPSGLGLGGANLVNAPAGGFPDDDTKTAWESGQFSLSAAPPDAPTTAGGFPLITGDQIIDRLKSAGSPGPRAPGPLTITAIDLGMGTFTTDRGPRQLPVWNVTFAGISEPAQVLAISPQGLFATPSPVGAATSVRVGAVELDGDRTVTVRFVGKRSGSGPCDGTYTLEVFESGQAVALVIHETTPAPTTTTSIASVIVGCDWVGHSRELTATLDRPLGNRVLIDGETRIPIPVT